jgi:hypothetical protein
MATTAVEANPTATFVTSEGSFVAEIFLDRLPLTCSNFIDLARTGFYDGLVSDERDAQQQKDSYLECAC